MVMTKRFLVSSFGIVCWNVLTKRQLAELLEKSAVSLNEESSTQKRTHGAPLHDAASNGHHKCLLVLLDHVLIFFSPPSATRTFFLAS